MLGSEGNENGKKTKTTIGLTSKKATLHVQHFFLYIPLPLFCTTLNTTLNSIQFNSILYSHYIRYLHKCT